jgi:predicted RNA-binding protein YlxR (DUF448 family)
MKSKQPKAKHVPVRTCIATGEKKPKNELIRIVKLIDGTVKVDPRSKLEGRGANLTMNIEAFEVAIKKKALNRALKLQRELKPEEIEQLRIDFEHAIAEKAFRPKDKPVTIRVKKVDLEKITDKSEE